MGIDNAIRAIAYTEASTLGGAIALIAKHRNELDSALREAASATQPISTEGAAAERALAAMDVAAQDAARHLVDKSA